MNKTIIKLLFGIVGFLFSVHIYGQIETDSIPELKYPFTENQQGSLYLSDFDNYEVIYDAENNKYIVISKIGDYEIRFPIVMSQSEYAQYRLKKEMHDYYKRKVGAMTKNQQNKDQQKDLLPKYYIDSNLFETLFGSNEIEVNLQGNIEIKFGALYQKIDNPQLSEKNRANTIFDFDQNIGASIAAKVGKRLKITANYDTQSTFDFQNLVKLEFDPSIGYDDDGIIRKIEVGNLSMPMRNTLISGAQNLFGLKTELQFGKTTITTAFAKQQSQSKSVSAQGGAIVEQFELKASDYDADRHFFLAQYFKENFDNALKEYPLVNASVQITKIEIWVTNTNRITENVRNIVALADLAESKNENIGNPQISITAPLPNFLPDNEVNELANVMTDINIRNISTVPNAFTGIATMGQGRDYSVLENARRLLEGTDFTINRELGFITLNRRLTDSEVLAVAFEYTTNGSSQIYKVGELSSDGIPENPNNGMPGNLVVKLLRSEVTITDVPLWDLMMKNVYNLQAYQLNQDGFRFEILYANDATGVPLNSLQNAATQGIAEKTLLNLLYLDRLDTSFNPLPEGDGYFDFVSQITVFPEKGYIMFPKVQPFGSYMGSLLVDSSDNRFIFNELYEYTQTEVKNNYQQKDKYELVGYFKSDSAQGIALGAFNIPQGSVVVTSGGRELIEGIDYVVDYQIGRVKIINPSIEASNAPIQVSLEQNSIFSQQRRSFFGLDVEHKVNKNLVVGASLLNLSERPFTNKVLYGQEPIKNWVFGANAAYQNTSRLLTKIANKISFGETTQESNFSIRGDFAYLLPGTPKTIDINGQASSYIDDFEGSQIPLELRSQQLWYLASTPQNQDIIVDSENNPITPDPTLLNLGGNLANSLDYGKKRAKIAWYNLNDDITGNNRPSSITNDEISRAEVRRVYATELFPNDQLDLTESPIISTLDVAYYPNERGSNNYDTENVDENGLFTDPETRWGGLVRPMIVTDFENSNIEYIQFWLMDPYENYSITQDEGLPNGINPNDPLNQVGELYFNLGNISEDILKDNRKQYENGLPENGGTENTEPTIWGKIPTNQSLLYAFDDDDTHRLNQDVGFDGLNDAEERTKYADFVNNLPANVQTKVLEDPSSDNFKYYLHQDYDNDNVAVLNRFKKYNLSQGNTPTANMSPNNYISAGTQYPDAEDINKDQTMSTTESYFQYKISLDKSDLNLDTNNYIIDKRTTEVTLENLDTKTTNWYQFRIPIASGQRVGGINNLHSVRFMRMFLTKFKMPVVLRFGQFELVRGEWRRYKYDYATGLNPLVGQDLENFESGVVNIEENDGKEPINYVLPPGIDRERLQGTTTVQLQNEQSLVLKVKDLEIEDARNLFKNVSFDMRMFKKLQMFIHAESRQSLPDNELVAILRIGSDLNENFYQIEQPLTITSDDAVSNSDIWPEENELNVDLDMLKKLKLERFQQAFSASELYPAPVSGEQAAYRLRVKGNPNLGKIKTIMIGVQNKSTNPVSAELWFNELRVSEFDNEGGWAAVISADANLSDVMDFSLAGRKTTIGYGNVDQSVNERNIEDVTQYDAVAAINAGKFLPEKTQMQIPLNVSISEEIKDPKYDPQYQDILMKDTDKENSPNRDVAQDYTKRTSFSIINFKKNRNPESKNKQRFYDIENFAASYSYNQIYHKDYNIEKYKDENVNTTLSYNYGFKPLNFEPFKNSKTLSAKNLKLLKDFNFNPIPTTFSVNAGILRTYNEQLSRDLVEIPGLSQLPTLVQRNFLFDWDYNLGFKPTNSIKLNFKATNNHVYDSFDYNDDVRLYSDFFNMGRPTHYHQTLDGSYQLPLDKFPLLGFIKSNYSYTADFDWLGSSPKYVEKTGNTIQNANTHNISVDLDMKKLYKDLGLESVLRNKNEREKDKKTRQLALKKMKENKEKDKKEKSVKQRKTTPSILNSKKELKAGQTMALGLYNMITAVKSVRMSYSENNGTLLPGYNPQVGLLGRDNFSGGLSPTFGFVFGSQVDIRNQALENGWLTARNTDDAYYSKIYARTHYDKLDLAAKVTPLKDFDIDLKANRIYTKNLSEQMDVVNTILNDNPQFAPSVITETGNFSTSYIMLGTSFKDPDELFNSFKTNRQKIAQRWSNKTSLPENGYGPVNQQVILPAFLAAYSGITADKIGLNPFRNIPLPNWQINYRGLMKLKWFKENFSSFSISHGYKSSYTIANFSNNSQFDKNNPGALDVTGNYFSEKLYSNVGLIEEFSPLVKVEMKLNNSLTLSGRINTDRMMTLNVNNNTMTQDNGKEYVLGLGYRIKDVPFNMRLQGKKMKFNGDVNIKLDVSLRDNKMMVRYFGIEDDITNDQITGGQKLFNLKLIADYNLTKNLQTGLYYIQDASNYYISTAFARQSISAGISFKYNLSNQ